MPAPSPSPQDFQRLYEAEFDFVWNSLRKLGTPSAHLEDVAHDVFVTAWKKLPDYDTARPLRPWLFGIAWRHASDFRQKASQVREVQGEEHDAPDEAHGPEELVARRQARTIVDRALLEVPAERRVVFVMHELEGFGIPEVAQSLEVPLNTAYSRLRLARRDFADAVQRLKGARA